MTTAAAARGVPRSAAAAALRLAALAGAAAALAAAHLHRPATVCPLRALTGLPCPFCGGTTAAVAVGRLDPVGALRANPVVVAGAGALALAPCGLGAWWYARPRGLRLGVVGLAVVAAEAWQLARFGVLPI